MAGNLTLFLSRMSEKRALRHWRKLAELAGTANLSTVRALRNRARELRRATNDVMQQADARLTLPLVGSNTTDAPLHADWVWRPESWRYPINPAGIAAFGNDTRFGEETVIFHDCKSSEMALRQTRNLRDDDLAPFGLRLEVFRFEGSFLSVVLQLPDEALSGLQRRHLIRLGAQIECEKPLEIFARLNIQHGPNTEQLIREIPLGTQEIAIDFDLGYSNLNEKRIEKAWVDLIFEGPEMNRVDLRDIVFSRRPRAEV